MPSNTHCPVCMTPDALDPYDTPDNIEVTEMMCRDLLAWHLNCRNYWRKRFDAYDALLNECMKILGAEEKGRSICSLPELIREALDTVDDRKGDKRKLKQENAELRESITNRTVELDRLRKAYREKTGEVPPL